MPTAKAEGTSKEVYLVDALPAGENHVGEVGTGGIVVDVTPVCDTLAYGAGDVLFPTTAVANAVRTSGGRALLTSVTLLDEDDQTAAVIDLYFLRSNAPLGAANGAPDISDTNAREIQGWVSLLAADFKDVTGAKVACVKNINLVVQPTTGTTMYVAGVCAGTPTQTASGIKLRLGFQYL